MLNQTQVSNLTPLTGLSALHTLWLNQTQVSDLTPLAGLSALRTLLLTQTQVSDLSPLAGLSALRTLLLTQTQISDLTPLAGLSALRSLWLNQTQVSDLTPLAGLSALQTLDLTQTQVSDLPPLAGLSALRSLGLNQTQVTDLTPLAGLSELETLWLRETQVSDLAPLAGLARMADLDLTGAPVRDLRPLRDMPDLGTGKAKWQRGLTFENTTACALDAELARLSEIEDNETRARETLAYLNALPPWPEPYTPQARPDGALPEAIGTKPPQQDPALPLIWGEQGFAFFANQVECDPVTEAALEDLRDLLNDLRRKGNRHDDLYQLAGELQARCAGEVSDLNLIKLHLSYQKLRRVYEGREGRQERFDDETVGVIDSVLTILPGVTLADPDVKVLITRQEEERAAEASTAKHGAAEQVLKDVTDKDAPFLPEVKDIASIVWAPGSDDRLSGAKFPLAHNVVVAVMRVVRDPRVEAVTLSLVGNFLWTYGDDLLAYARFMGDDALTWAQAVLVQFRAHFDVGLGVLIESTRSGAASLPKRDRDTPERGTD